MSDVLTLWDLDTLHGLVIDGARSLLEELVSLHADVKNLRVRDAKLDQLFHRRMDDICSDLHGARKTRGYVTSEHD